MGKGGCCFKQIRQQHASKVWHQYVYLREDERRCCPLLELILVGVGDVVNFDKAVVATDDQLARSGRGDVIKVERRYGRLLRRRFEEPVDVGPGPAPADEAQVAIRGAEDDALAALAAVVVQQV